MLTWTPSLCKFGRNRAVCVVEKAICAKTLHTDRQPDRQTDRRQTSHDCISSWNELKCRPYFWKLQIRRLQPSPHSGWTTVLREKPAKTTSVSEKRHSFYSTMLRRVRLCHSRSTSTVCLSVHLSICDVHGVFHTRCNTWKIISRPNSLRYVHKLTPAAAI